METSHGHSHRSFLTRSACVVRPMIAAALRGVGEPEKNESKIVSGIKISSAREEHVSSVTLSERPVSLSSSSASSSV